MKVDIIYKGKMYYKYHVAELYYGRCLIICFANGAKEELALSKINFLRVHND